MRPKPPPETEEQKAVRIRSEAENVRSIQETAEQRTSLFNRMRGGRQSITRRKRM